MRLLVVEDEAPTVAYLRRGLSEEGFDIDVAFSAMQAEEAVRTGHYDAILLDVMLPGGSGFALCRAWRERGITTPILFLTARDDVADRVQGLNYGGDDYLVKPFAFAELLARVRALLRRNHVPPPPSPLRMAGMEVDTERRRVTRSGEIIPLTAREYQMLEYFVLHVNKVVTRAELWENVWGEEGEPDSNVIDVYIRYLRKKLGRTKSVIETVRGAGYILNAPEGETENA